MCPIYWRLVIHIMPLSLEQLQCAWVKPYMPSTKADQPQKNKPQQPASQCPNCTHLHPSGHDNCPAWNAICKGCSKKGHWHAKCHSSGTAGQQPTKSNGAEKAPHHQCHGRGKKADMVQVNTEEALPCNELSSMWSIVEL